MENGFAPSSISTNAASACPLMQARCRGVSPLLSLVQARVSMISSGVSPSSRMGCSAVLLAAFRAPAIACMASAWPSLAATCHADWPPANGKVQVQRQPFSSCPGGWKKAVRTSAAQSICIKGGGSSHADKPYILLVYTGRYLPTSGFVVS